MYHGRHYGCCSGRSTADRQTDKTEKRSKVYPCRTPLHGSRFGAVLHLKVGRRADLHPRLIQFSEIFAS